MLAEEFVFSLLLLVPVEEQDDGNRFALKVETKVLSLTKLVCYIPVIEFFFWFFWGIIGFGSSR